MGMKAGESVTFNYKGSVDSWTVPGTGVYKLEVWGGEGPTGTTGKGGYSVGYKYFKSGTKLYICVGGQGDGRSPFTYIGPTYGGYNGGGNGKNYSYGDEAADKRTGSGGGGATHIALVTGTLQSIGYASFVTQGNGLIVAGGGGGGSVRMEGDPPPIYNPGSGGGLTGGSNEGGSASGGGQTGGGSGMFGKGGNNSSENWGGGGGGGLFGGAGGNGYSANSPGAGGSGYIGGVPAFDYKGVRYSPATYNGYRSGHGMAKITKMTDSATVFLGTKECEVYLGTKEIGSIYLGDTELG